MNKGNNCHKILRLKITLGSFHYTNSIFLVIDMLMNMERGFITKFPYIGGLGNTLLNSSYDLNRWEINFTGHYYKFFTHYNSLSGRLYNILYNKYKLQENKRLWKLWMRHPHSNLYGGWVGASFSTDIVLKIAWNVGDDECLQFASIVLLRQ